MMNKSYLLLAAMLASPSLWAASFDCSKAGTAVEKMICADEQVSKLDSDLSAAYKDALGKTDNKYQLKLEQREWIKQRNICDEVKCLIDQYKKRISFLDTTIASKTTSSHANNNATPYKHGFSRLYVDPDHSYRSEMCAAFLDYLKTTYKDGDCLPRSYPKDAKLKFPIFTPIDINQFEEQEIERVSVEEADPQKKDAAIKRIRERYKNGEQRGWIANFDLDNDGRIEKILYRKSLYPYSSAYCRDPSGIEEILNDSDFDYSHRTMPFGGIPFTFDGVSYLGGEQDVIEVRRQDESDLQYEISSFNGDYLLGRVCLFSRK